MNGLRRNAAAGEDAGGSADPMIPWRSIKFSLTVVFLLFVVLVSILGAFAISELKAVNEVSEEIRDRWLQSTRVLGDLNNFTSDARAAEASRLLAQDAGQQAEVDRVIDDLDRQIARSERAYQRIPHDAEEEPLYRRFAAAWNAYENIARRVLTMARQHRAAQAAALYMTASLRAYAQASDALGVLTNRTVVRAGQASEQALATYASARALILLVIVLASLSLVAAVNYITRVISRPLLGLAARMRSLAANDTNIDIEGARRRDEIGEMARAVVVFRNNAIELAHSQRGLMQQATMLEERLEAERKLTLLQRNFVSMASHEFRTPLTIIDGHAQRLIAMRTQLQPHDIADRAGRIRGAVQRMTHVIDSLLNSSRLFDGEAGLYFHPTRFEPEALLHEVCHLHREISAGAQIVENLRGLPRAMIGDPKLLYQAFSNLLSNAVKYSPDGGLVELTAVSEADHLVVKVEDRGLGIPEADRERVFDRYHRGANVTGVVGTGIGLYLVKMVVDLHGGEITVDSQEGRGSRFVVRLPLGVPSE
jgi:two-component system OmpR family sensor kinase